VVVEDFSENEITSVVVIERRLELRAQLLDCVMCVERQQVADRLFVVTRHEYHTWTGSRDNIASLSHLDR